MLRFFLTSTSDVANHGRVKGLAASFRYVITSYQDRGAQRRSLFVALSHQAQTLANNLTRRGIAAALFFLDESREVAREADVERIRRHGVSLPRPPNFAKVRRVRPVREYRLHERAGLASRMAVAGAIPFLGAAAPFDPALRAAQAVRHLCRERSRRPSALEPLGSVERGDLFVVER